MLVLVSSWIGVKTRTIGQCLMTSAPLHRLYIYASTSMSSPLPTASLHAFYLHKTLRQCSSFVIVCIGALCFYFLFLATVWDVIVIVILRCVNFFSLGFLFDITATNDQGPILCRNQVYKCTGTAQKHHITASIQITFQGFLERSRHLIAIDVA